MPSKLIQEITPVRDTTQSWKLSPFGRCCRCTWEYPRTLSHSLIIYLLIINLNLSTTRVWSNYGNYIVSRLHWIEQIIKVTLFFLTNTRRMLQYFLFHVCFIVSTIKRYIIIFFSYLASRWQLVKVKSKSFRL